MTTLMCNHKIIPRNQKNKSSSNPAKFQYLYMLYIQEMGAFSNHLT